jgi:glycosyltransferase involved in cell wall biosynthesis
MILRVAVDATALPAQRVGAGVAAVELLRAIDDTVELHVFVNSRDAPHLGTVLPKATLHPFELRSRPVRLMWGHALLARRVKSLGPDVYWGPHYTIPRGLTCPSVVTFHDPTFFTLPHLHERAKVAYFSRAARTGIRRAAFTVTPSAYAMRGAIEVAGADSRRIDVVPHGVDHSLYRPGRGPSSERPYILFVGTLEPRKDVPTLITAYERLAHQGRTEELVLAGPPGWGTAAVDAALERLGHGSVRRLGFVPEEEKITLYQGASLVVYPSIAEGFGLPVLEAMACGAPVVTTKGSATEEVAGDGALLVEPGDAEGLVQAMRKVLEDPGLASELGRRGQLRAGPYTWGAAAERMVSVWSRAAGASE